MAPIRIGIIGLSKSAKTSWAGIGHLPYLQTVTDKFPITALCNTSVTAAQKAISEYGLPSATKAYGDPNDLAKDPNVDLVVCCTRVDSHYATIRPSIKAGKNVFVEWPLASRVEEARELAYLAEKHGVTAMVGLQGRVSPIVITVKRLLGAGEIGQVLSSSVIASGGTRLRDALPQGLKYFTERDVGGNVVTIGFAHSMFLPIFCLGILIFAALSQILISSYAIITNFECSDRFHSHCPFFRVLLSHCSPPYSATTRANHR